MAADLDGSVAFVDASLTTSSFKTIADGAAFSFGAAAAAPAVSAFVGLSEGNGRFELAKNFALTDRVTLLTDGYYDTYSR